MRKNEQLIINELCKNACELFNNTHNFYYNTERLRTCTAYTMESENYIVLVSYKTIIAIYDKNNNTMYDVLRYVYGYTATSAQHIAKFRNDYCRGAKELRYYRV